MYADDTKIYHLIHDIADCCKMQEDLNKFANYCPLNLLNPNIKNGK